MYALITGASSGIGIEFATLLAKNKYDLIIVARRTKRLMELKERLETTYHVNVIAKTADLSDRTSCVELFEEYKLYPVQILINNAGFGKTGRFDAIPLDEELCMIDTNITALHILTKLFARHMEKGYILNVSSIAGHMPIPMMATYGATKAYVLSISQSVNYEMRKCKKTVYISALCPGPVTTEFNQVAGASHDLHAISARECAIAGLKGLFKKRPVIYPCGETKLMSILNKFAPMKAVLPIEYIIQSKKMS